MVAAGRQPVEVEARWTVSGFDGHAKPYLRRSECMVRGLEPHALLSVGFLLINYEGSKKN